MRDEAEHRLDIDWAFSLSESLSGLPLDVEGMITLTSFTMGSSTARVVVQVWDTGGDLPVGERGDVMCMRTQDIYVYIF